MNAKLPESIQTCVELIIQKAQPKKIILFGSRARKTHRSNSDFDFAVIAKKCTEAEWASLLIEIQEEPYTLHKIDLVEFEKLNQDYKDQIKNQGIILYESNS